MTRTAPQHPAGWFSSPALDPGDYAAWYKHVTGEWVFDFLAGQISNIRTGRLVPFRVNDTGYLAADVMVNGVRVRVLKHRAIWIAAHGLLAFPPDYALDVDLINHVKTDCRLENLRLVRPRKKHVVRTRQLTPDEVKEIRRIFSEGSMTVPEIACWFGVNPRTILRLLRGQTYREVCDV